MERAGRREREPSHQPLDRRIVAPSVLDQRAEVFVQSKQHHVGTTLVASACKPWFDSLGSLAPSSRVRRDAHVDAAGEQTDPELATLAGRKLVAEASNVVQDPGREREIAGGHVAMRQAVAGTLELLLVIARREINVGTEEIESGFATARDGPEYGLSWPILVTGDVGGEHSGLRNRVFVEEQEQFAPRDGRAAIACRGDSVDVCALEPHLEGPRARRGRRSRRVRIRGDDDDFDLIGHSCRSGEPFQQTADGARLLPVGEDDAETGCVRHDRDERADRRARR